MNHRTTGRLRKIPSTIWVFLLLFAFYAITNRYK